MCWWILNNYLILKRQVNSMMPACRIRTYKMFCGCLPFVKIFLLLPFSSNALCHDRDRLTKIGLSNTPRKPLFGWIVGQVLSPKRYFTIFLKWYFSYFFPGWSNLQLCQNVRCQQLESLPNTMILDLPMKSNKCETHSSPRQLHKSRIHMNTYDEIKVLPATDGCKAKFQIHT